MNTVTIPCVVLISPTTALIANFGQRDFSFAIVQHLAQERCNAVTQAIEDKLTADLANVEMQSLVFDYLMRNGYLATANAMARPSAVPRPSSFSPSVNSALADAESIPVDASASATTTNPALESFSSSPSRSPQSQDLNNGITDQDALDSNSTNTKSSTTQPNPSQYSSSLSPKLKRWARKWSLKELFKSPPSASLRRRKTRLDSFESPITEPEVTPTSPEVRPMPSTSSSFQPPPPSIEASSRSPPTGVGGEGLQCGGGDPWPETLEAARRRIRLSELISQGHYMEAILQLNHDYANLVATMPSIVFVLQCRYFIDLLFSNLRPPEPNPGLTSLPNHVAPAKTTSVSSKQNCKKNGKLGGAFKRPLTVISPDVSPSGGGSIRQSAAIRRKCEDTNGSMNGTARDEEEDGDGGFSLECIRQENGTVAVLQPPRPTQNGVATKEKRKTITAFPRSLVKSSSLNSIVKESEISTQNGVANHDPSTPPMGSLPALVASMTNPMQESHRAALDFNGIVQMGRELRDTARELQTRNVLSMDQVNLLQDAFALIAYESPYESPFADLIHPRHRKILADSVSNAIMMNMGKARFPLLEIGIGLLEEIVMDGQSGSRSKFGHGFAKVHRKSHNHASTSSAGSTLTPSHTASTSINIPSTSGVYATAVAATSSSSPTTRSTASGTGGLQYHRRHRHHHRSATSSLVVTSTTTTSTSAASVRTRNPLPLLASLPPPAVSSSSLRHRSSSSSNIGRRLRSTTVQSAPRDVLGPSTSAVSAGEIVDEEGSLNEVVVSGPGAGINWPEEVVATATAAASSADNEVDVALTVAEIETGGEIEEVLVFPEGGRRLRVDRYMSSGSSVQASHSPPSPPPPMGQNGTSIDVRVGGSELAGFFHPILFVPPMPH